MNIARFASFRRIHIGIMVKVDLHTVSMCVYIGVVLGSIVDWRWRCIVDTHDDMSIMKLIVDVCKMYVPIITHLVKFYRLAYSKWEWVARRKIKVSQTPSCISSHTHLHQERGWWGGGVVRCTKHFTVKHKYIPARQTTTSAYFNSIPIWINTPVHFSSMAFSIMLFSNHLHTYTHSI